MGRWTKARPVRWLVRQGGPRWLLRSAAGAGNLPARLLASRHEPEKAYELQGLIRAEGPLSGSRTLLATGRYDVVEAVLTDDDFEAGVGASWTARFALEAGMDERSRGPLETPSLLVSDPPEHTRMRRLVSRAFTPRAIRGMEPRVHEITAELLDRLEGLAASGEPVDVVEHFAKRLPVAVIADLLAVPVGMLDQILRWADDAAPALDFGVTYREFRAADVALTQTNAWLVGHFERLRANPGEDLFSELVRISDEDGSRLSGSELVSLAQLLVAAGFVTVVDMLGNGIVALLRHPDQLDGLRADPTGWPNAVEEILRYESPVQITARFCVRSREFEGRVLPKGQGVMAVLGAANRDPEIFARPGTFDVRRENAHDHLAFSRGIHHCLGAGLARLEGQVALRNIMERFPQMTLVGEPRLRASAMVRGFEQVFVLLGPPRADDPVCSRGEEATP